MIEVKKEEIILTKTSLIFEKEGVLNPAKKGGGDIVDLFYLVVSEGTPWN